MSYSMSQLREPESECVRTGHNFHLTPISCTLRTRQRWFCLSPRMISPSCLGCHKSRVSSSPGGNRVHGGNCRNRSNMLSLFLYVSLCLWTRLGFLEKMGHKDFFLSFSVFLLGCSLAHMLGMNPHQ